MAIKRLSVFKRARALVLFKNGKSVDEVVRILQKRYHPTRSVLEVKSKYFPSTGSYSISKLQGASREKILGSMRNMRSYAMRMKKLQHAPVFARARLERLKVFNSDPVFVKANSERMRARHKDPVFAKAHSERARKLNSNPVFARANSERMRLRNLDPVFAMANSKRGVLHMQKLNQDKEFKRKRLDGVARHWNTYRLRIKDEAERLGIVTGVEYVHGRSSFEGERKQVVPATSINPLTKLLLKERRKVISVALKELSEAERTVVNLVFGFTEGEMNLNQAALVLNKSKGEVELLFKSALTKLSSNPELKKLK